MTTNEYDKALEKAKQELDHLLRERADIDRKIERLKATIEALSALREPTDYAMTPIPFEDDMPRGFGITMTIRECLKGSVVPLTPVQLRDALVAKGIDVSGYANVMSVIHNTIKRLVEQGEVMPVRSANGPLIGYTVVGMVYDKSNMPPAKK